MNRTFSRNVLHPAETPKEKRQEQHDEITREIARYLAMGKKINVIEKGVSGERIEPQHDHKKRGF